MTSKTEDKTNHLSGENVESNSKKETKKKKSKKFTTRQKMALVMLATVDFMSFCSMSILAPFYPKESALKGMSETTAGFVFGFYALVVVISSPIFGKIIPTLGVKFSFTIGVLVSGICSVVFGTLHLVNDYYWFAGLSFVIRGLEALGASAYSTAGYVIIVNVFPDHAGTVRGLLETFVGLGMSAGPAIGGLLFAVGGFGLPFYVIGLIIIAIAPLNIYLLPVIDNFTVESKSGSFKNLLRLPQVLMTCLIVVVGSATWGFLDPTLEPHLRQFNLSPGQIGLVFLLLSAMYGISCPGWGWLSDKIDNYWWLMSAGLFFNAFSLLLLGPTSLFPFLKSTISLNMVSLTILGISVAMAQMPTYRGLLDGALDGGFIENIGTHSLIAGLWSCVYSLGEFLGPVIGGVLMENYDFPISSTVFAFVNIVTAVLYTMYYLTGCSKKIPKIIDKKHEVFKESYKSTEISIIELPQNLKKTLFVLK